MATKPKVGQITATKPRFEYVDDASVQFEGARFYNQAPVQPAEVQKPLGMLDLFRRGISSTVDAGRIAATNDAGEIAGIISESQKNEPKQTPLQSQMAAEIAPYADRAKQAEGVIDNVSAYGSLAAKRISQFASNPREFAGMIAQNLPNSMPGVAGGIAGAVGGSAIAGPIGTVVGGIVGGTAGGYAVEQGSAMQEQILKDAQKFGVDPTDPVALKGLIDSKYPEYLEASRMKGIGTAGTDAALNVATMGFAGMGERMLVKEARMLTTMAEAGKITAKQATEGTAAILAKDAARNTFKAKLLRGSAITGSEVFGEGFSEGVGQKLAYGEVDAVSVVDESLLGVGTGIGMAAGHKSIARLTGASEKNPVEMELQKLLPVLAKQAEADAIRAAELVPESGPTARAANAGTEAKARSVEAMPTASITGADPAQMLQDQSAGGNPFMDRLNQPREDLATSNINLDKLAQTTPPLDEQNATRILNEAKLQGHDFALAPHPQGGYMVVPRQWVAPEMSSAAEADAADFLGLVDTERRDQQVMQAQIDQEHQKQAEIEAAFAAKPELDATTAAVEQAATIDAPNAMQAAFNKLADKTIGPEAEAPPVAPKEPRIVARTPGMKPMPLELAELQVSMAGGEVARVQNANGKFGYVVVPKPAAKLTAATAKTDTGTQEGDTFNSKGKPFTNFFSANTEASKLGAGFEPVKLADNAFVVRKIEENKPLEQAGQATQAIETVATKETQDVNQAPQAIQAEAQGQAAPAAEVAPIAEAQADALIKVTDLYGKTHHVKQSALDGASDKLPLFDSKGARAGGSILRENLDPTGEKLAALNKENQDNPLFDVITTKLGNPFLTKMAAARELKVRALGDTHEVVAADTVKPDAVGFFVKKKAASVANPDKSDAANIKNPNLATEVDHAGDFYIRPVEVSEHLIKTGNINGLYKSAGVKSADAFGNLPLANQSNAYAKFVNEGGMPAPAAIEAYDDKVRRMEYEGVVRRLQSDKEVNQANGKPFKTQVSANKFSSEFDLGDTHKTTETEGGFTLQRLGEAQRPSVLKKIAQQRANDPETIRQEAAFSQAESIGPKASDALSAYENGDTTIDEFEQALELAKNGKSKPNNQKPDATEQQVSDEMEAQYQQSIKEAIQARLGKTPVNTEPAQKKTPFKAFLQQHGIAPVHASDIAGRNRFKANNMLPATFRKGGLDLDSLVERAIERGFMTEADRGDQGKLISMIQSEIAGDAQVSTEFADEDAAAQTERAQRMETEGEADKMGLPYNADTRTDVLASMVKRVAMRLAGEPVGTTKAQRIIERAKETVARIERKRAKFDADLAGFANATIAERDALLDIYTDEDGNPIIVRASDVRAEQAWAEINGTWNEQNGQTNTSATRNSQEDSAPFTSQPEESAGDGAQGRSEAQPGSPATPAGQPEEGLTAPTRAEVLAQQDRTDNAQALDDKAQIDAEASRQTLTQQTAPEQRKDTSGDMFGEEKAGLESAKREADAVAKNEAAKDPNQGSMFDAPAEPEAKAATPAQPAAEVDDGIIIKRGKGLIKDKFLSEVDGDGVPGGPFDNESEARGAAEAWRAKKSDRATEDATERSRRDALAEKIKAGTEPTAGEIKSLDLAAGESDIRWFFPTAANLFSLNSRQIRPLVASLIRVGTNDMGTKRELVPTKKALVLIGQSFADKDAEVQPKPAKIEDSGQVLEGARKLYAKAYAAKMDEGAGMDTAAVPLSKSWPEPDYQRLLDDGADPWAVAMARAMREEVPTKPSSWKIKAWVRKVESLRAMTNDVMSGAMSKEKFKATGGQFNLADWFNKIDLYEAIGHEKSLKTLKFSKGEYGMYGGQTFSPAKTLWTINMPGASNAASWSNGNWGNDLVVADTKAEAVEKFKAWSAAQVEKAPTEAKATSFDVYGYWSNTDIIIVGKRLGGTKSVDLKEFATSKEARAYIANNQAELERLLAAAKFEQPERGESNAPRVGDDHRGGADVTSEQFREAFGFRGEQFDASMPQGERQANMNQAYDALMDLAGVVGIEPKALSLNGELGLAFGARGTGGKNPAAAHYERDTTGAVTPNRVVINLTRKNGAGSLAHEWFHAVDNYFARMRGEKAGMLTESYANKGEGVRPEMVEAFKRVIMAIQSSGVRERSKRLDKKRVKDYWSTGLEMAARSFESYVIARLQDKNGSNDYLANIVPEALYTMQGSYPYPVMGEMPAIRAAFDNFFGVVQTKETEQGVAMFSRSKAGPDGKSDVLSKDGKFKGWPERRSWTRQEYSDVVSLLPKAYRDDAHRLEPVATKDWDALAASALPDLEALNEVSGAGTFRLDDLGNILVDERKSGRDAIVEDALPIAKKYGLGIFITGIRTESMPYFADAGFVSEMGLGAVLARSTGSNAPVVPMASGLINNPTYGTMMSYKPRGFPGPMFARSGAPTRGLPTSQVTSIIDAIRARWGNAPEIIVAANMGDPLIPQAVRDHDQVQKSQGATGEPEGFVYKGKVYIVAGELATPTDVIRVLFHESLGHVGLRGVFGDKLKPILDQLAALRRADIIKKARQYGLVRSDANGKPVVDVKTATDKEVFAAMDQGHKREAAEEVLAVMAQTHPEIGFVKRAIALIRGWLRKNAPGFLGMKMTDADIITQFILPARRFVEGKGGPDGGKKALFNTPESDYTLPDGSNPDASTKASPEQIERLIQSGSAGVGFGNVPAFIGRPINSYLMDGRILGELTAALGSRIAGFATNPVLDESQRAKVRKFNGVYLNGTIYIREGTDRPNLAVLGHEFGHYLKDKRPDLYDRLVDAIRPYIKGEKYVTFKDAPVASKLSDPSDIREEFIGEVFSDGFMDKAFWKTVGDGSPSLLKDLVSALQSLIDVIKSKLPYTKRTEKFLTDFDAVMKIAGETLAEFSANPEIRFSRGPISQAVQSTQDALKNATATDLLKQFGNRLSDFRGLGLQTLGRRQLVDIYNKDLPAMTAYSDMVAQMDADKNESGAEADGLATDWGKLTDERQLAELMHDATLAQVDPDKDFIKGDDRNFYDALKDGFDKLTPGAKTAYRTARDMYAAHNDKVRKAIQERIMRSELSPAKKKALLERMDGEFFKQIKGVYFPLARFGQYVTIVKDSTGSVVSANRSETMNEAEATRKTLQAQFPATGGYKVGKVLKDREFNAARDGVGRGFMADLFDTLENTGAGEELMDSISQLYLAALPDLSWAKHGIHRKGMPGFSQDARRAFAQNMFHGARYLAKLRYADQLQAGLDVMQEHIGKQADNEAYDSVKAQQVVDEMVKRHESMMNPQSNPLSTALTSLGFVFHLGLSPASALVNLSQTALVALPVMGAKWGFRKSSAALLLASKQAASSKNDISTALNNDERKAYDEAVRRGVIDVTMAHDLAGISQGEDSKVSNAIKPVMKYASFLFHHAEKFNRQVTFVAAYRLSREAGVPHDKAFDEAVTATYDGHFDYSASNRPRLMQGNVAKVVFLFKQYAQNMIYTLTRNAQQAIKAETPEKRAEARKALAGLLVSHAMGAGVFGLPLVGMLLAAASAIGGDDDEPWDAKVALQNMLADSIGPKAADVFAHGLSRLTPWDISGRIGLDHLLLPDVQEGLEGTRAAESWAAQALGPVVGIGINAAKGLGEIAKGEYQRGLESMMPTVLRGPLKAYRYETQGNIDKTGVAINDEVGAAGVVGQALGFSPSETRLAQEGKSAIYSADRAIQDRRTSLVRQFSLASMATDAEGVQDARKDIARFNEKNPKARITQSQLVSSIRARQRRINEAKQGVYLPSKRQDAMEAGRFALME